MENKINVLKNQQYGNEHLLLFAGFFPLEFKLIIFPSLNAFFLSLSWFLENALRAGGFSSTRKEILIRLSIVKAETDAARSRKGLGRNKTFLYFYVRTPSYLFVSERSGNLWEKMALRRGAKNKRRALVLLMCDRTEKTPKDSVKEDTYSDWFTKTRGLFLCLLKLDLVKGFILFPSAAAAFIRLNSVGLTPISSSLYSQVVFQGGKFSLNF